ncbi:MAG TPA: C25 family cysteine peptidase, partial [Gemmataceae bacterium]|nr:C25 family cysteine peptidase [Gemmataceae bacterium]
FTRAFLESDQTKHVLLFGNSFSDSLDFQRLPKIDGVVHGGSAADFQALMVTQTSRVVVVPKQSRRLLLHAACLAGALQAPLHILEDNKHSISSLKRQIAEARTREVYAVGGTSEILGNLSNTRVVELGDENAVALAYVKIQCERGPIDTLVLANPADVVSGSGNPMSTLAPWIALQKRAALVLTNDKGDNAEDAIMAALENPAIAKADTLVIAADLKAIPMCKRPNPIEDDRDAFIEMEPMTPHGDKPCSFAVGRIFHEDRNVVALMLARERLLQKEKHPKAIMISNPGGGLPLLETFSRHTADEFKNAGYDLTAHIGRGAYKTELKKKLPDANVFLWEGHVNTLFGSYAIQEWDEPLKPSLIFLQSCLALEESRANPFLQRGAVAVIGSSTRTYSGSGGALALAFFDTLLYEDQTLGGSLRQAKNFMLAFAELKKKRFGESSKLGGANVRAAWAFTLWGDPTINMPKPARPDGALAPVRHVVQGNTIIVTLPDEKHGQINSAKYSAVVPANARLAGLVKKQDMSDQHKLVPFTFAEVELPDAKPGVTPRIRTNLPDTHYVFCYDERCQRGYLLVTPRAKDHGELKFQLDWE